MGFRISTSLPMAGCVCLNLALALKFGAPMVVGAAIRIGPGQFKILSQMVEIMEGDTIETLTQRHVKILESFIRQYPEQYFWLHRKFKNLPEGYPDYYSDLDALK